MPVAQPKGSKPLPPFQRWAFAEEHYLQFLCDLLSVHSALEAALEACTRGGEAALLPGGDVWWHCLPGCRHLQRVPGVPGPAERLSLTG